MKMNSRRAKELLVPLQEGTANMESKEWCSRLIESLERVIDAEQEIQDLHLRLSAALENTIIHKCRSCEGYYNEGWVCSCSRDNSISDKEWEELQKGN